jgi:hypothetical protein
VDAAAPAGWQLLTYRAVAWSADDNLLGLVGGRSPASSPASALLLPGAPPDLSDLRVNEHGSTVAHSLVSWSSSAPLAITPLGPHVTILAAQDAAGAETERLEGALDALAFKAGLADLPPADAANPQIFRIGAAGGPGYRFYAWAARPAADQSFRVTVKVIDPLGRMASTSAEIPPIPALPPPELSALQLNRVGPPLVPPPARIVASWQIKSPVPPDALDQFSLRVQARLPSQPAAQPLDVQATLDQIPEVLIPQLAPSQLVALFNRVVRLQGSQQYALLLRTAPAVEVTVTLVDPQGQAVTRTGAL